MVLNLMYRSMLKLSQIKFFAVLIGTAFFILFFPKIITASGAPILTHVLVESLFFPYTWPADATLLLWCLAFVTCTFLDQFFYIKLLGQKWGGPLSVLRTNLQEHYMYKTSEQLSGIFAGIVHISLVHLGLLTFLDYGSKSEDMYTDHICSFINQITKGYLYQTLIYTSFFQNYGLENAFTVNFAFTVTFSSVVNVEFFHKILVMDSSGNTDPWGFSWNIARASNVEALFNWLSQTLCYIPLWIHFINCNLDQSALYRHDLCLGYGVSWFISYSKSWDWFRISRGLFCSRLVYNPALKVQLFLSLFTISLMLGLKYRISQVYRRRF
uniref:Uncharacterized protein n=1 Tax=Chromera velia TaxID=505693 RepID=D9IXF7_9ALVE|nr:hypothetical protein CHVEC_pgp013 [Chromera velia]ADJ66565.1 hypothetical protein [Chromera velia]